MRMRRRRGRRRRYCFKRLRFNIKKWKKVFIVVIIIWVIFQFLSFMYRNVYAVVMDYATTQTVNIATQIIQEGIARSELSSYEIEDFIFSNENSNNLTINTPLVNQLRVSITQQIEELLFLVERGDLDQVGLGSHEGLRDGVLFEVPWAAAFNLTLFHQLGPRTPVRANVIGNVISDIETKQTDFGINNTLLEIVLAVEVNLHVALPFRSENTTVEVGIPLVTTTIQGEIPDVFLGSGLR